MGELSDRFAELMARMAKSDADLYRTIGEQNASVRQMVDDLVPPADTAATSANAALAPSALLPAEDCALRALKKRFGKVAEAQAWIESQIGKAPKKPTWAVIESTCRSGAWPVKTTSSGSSRSKGLSETRFEQGLKALEDRLDERLQRIELILTLLANALPQSTLEGAISKLE
jgi:hypothetical protein